MDLHGVNEDIITFIRAEGNSDQSYDGGSDVVNDDVPSSSNHIEDSPNDGDHGDLSKDVTT